MHGTCPVRCRRVQKHLPGALGHDPAALRPRKQIYGIGGIRAVPEGFEPEPTLHPPRHGGCASLPCDSVPDRGRRAEGAWGNRPNRADEIRAVRRGDIGRNPHWDAGAQELVDIVCRERIESTALAKVQSFNVLRGGRGTGRAPPPPIAPGHAVCLLPLGQHH